MSRDHRSARIVTKNGFSALVHGEDVNKVQKRDTTIDPSSNNIVAKMADDFLREEVFGPCVEESVRLAQGKGKTLTAEHAEVASKRTPGCFDQIVG